MVNKSFSNIISEPAAAYATTGSRLDLVTLSRKGIKKQALLNLASTLNLNIKEMAELLPVTERTLQRRDANNRLSAAVSEHIILLAEVTDKGAGIFGDIASFREWLQEPNTALGGQRPISLLDTAIGIQIITDQLGKIQYGVYS